MDLLSSLIDPASASGISGTPSAAAHDLDPDPTAPLLLTADDLLLAELLPLTAAAELTPQVVGDPVAALSAWARAGVVLVGADLAADVVRLGPERREHVYVLARGQAPDALFRCAVELGARQVVSLPASAGWVVDLLTDCTEQRTTPGRLVGVVGGSGGAGATTLACALAQRAAASGPAVVVDADPQGPGLDRILGMDRCEGFRWDALCSTTGRLSARAFHDALPRRDRLGVLSWYAGSPPRSLQAFAVREALSAGRRGHDAVVVDLPRSGDQLVDEVAARCDHLVVVVAATLTGVAGAARMRARFADHGSVGLVVRGEQMDAADIGAVVGLPVLAQMRDQRGLDESVEAGLGPLRSTRGPLARAADAVWAGLAGVSR